MASCSAPPVQEQISSLPLPPVQYITQFSDENIKRGRAPKPPPPIQDSYSMFGRPFNADDTIIRPLESQGIKRLYPQHFDRKKELKKLNHSLLVNFMDLLDLLVYSPESPRRPEKVEDLSVLFIHVHHLLNEFRPHQAREALRVMMELQKRSRVETATRFCQHLDKANEILHQALENLPDAQLDTKLLALTEYEDAGQDSGMKRGKKFDDCNPKEGSLCRMTNFKAFKKKYEEQKSAAIAGNRMEI